MAYRQHAQTCANGARRQAEQRAGGGPEAGPGEQHQQRRARQGQHRQQDVHQEQDRRGGARVILHQAKEVFVLATPVFEGKSPRIRPAGQPPEQDADPRQRQCIQEMARRD